MLAFLLVCAVTVHSGCARPAARSAETGRETSLHAHPGSCRQCHVEGVEPSGVPFNPPRRDACSSAGCHGPILEKLARLHGPVAIGECSACHLPHASAYAGLLRRRPETLCRGCHQALYTCPARREGEGAECASCHDAHGGADARFLHDHLAARDGSR